MIATYYPRCQEPEECDVILSSEEHHGSMRTKDGCIILDEVVVLLHTSLSFLQQLQVVYEVEGFHVG